MGEVLDGDEGPQDSALHHVEGVPYAYATRWDWSLA